MNHKGMKYSLCSRELIADSIEVMLTAHPLDAVVFIPNCDKIVPGMLLAACRMNLPSVFVSGGPMLPGEFRGERIGFSELSEAVGSYAAGKMSEADLQEMEEAACPGCGSCSGMYTANSMNCLTEAIGMALPGNGTIPAVYSARIRLAKEAGEQIMELYKQNRKPSDILTEKAFTNALRSEMALGCSTNSVLHLTAVAYEMGVPLEKIAFVGDDLNDLPAFDVVGLPITVANAPQEVKDKAACVTKARGGEGAVREIIEAILRGQGRWKPLSRTICRFCAIRNA
jgi:dihydroxy-acid dehydratase